MQGQDNQHQGRWNHQAGTANKLPPHLEHRAGHWKPTGCPVWTQTRLPQPLSGHALRCPTCNHRARFGRRQAATISSSSTSSTSSTVATQESRTWVDSVGVSVASKHSPHVCGHRPRLKTDQNVAAIVQCVAIGWASLTEPPSAAPPPASPRVARRLRRLGQHAACRQL